MNIIKILFIFFVLGTITVGCGFDKDSSYIRMSDRIVDEYLVEMKNQYGLSCFGSGGGFLDRVNEIIISFETTGPKSKKVLRELIVKINEDLLRRYNENKEIRPYLKDYPFTVDNLRVGIILVDRQGIGIHNDGSGKNDFYAIYQNWGRLQYFIENDEKPGPQDVFEETYEEALAIVKAGNPELFTK